MTEQDRTQTPERWHQKNHRSEFHRGIGVSDCYSCQKQIAHCKSKQAYDTAEYAHAYAQELNVERNWTPPTYAYWCRYCTHWHLATVRGIRRKRKVERKRRKWLRAQIEH